MEEIIRLGHYQRTTTIGSDNPEIIRVLGEKKDRPGYFNTQDGKIMPAYELNEYWTYLDTLSSLKSEVKKPPLNIFAGLGDIDEAEEEESYGPPTPLISPIPKNFDKMFEGIPKANIVGSSCQTLNEVPSFVEEPIEHKVIEKLRINNVITIPVTLNIPINYDIEKLSNTIDILELNKNNVVDYLLSKIDISLIDVVLKKQLLEIINRKSFDTQKNESNYVSKTNEKASIDNFDRNTTTERTIKEKVDGIKEKVGEINQQNEIELSEGLNDIDNFLKGLVE